MNQKILALLITAACCQCTFADGNTSTPAPAAASGAARLQEQNTDEIDLEEVDDSAEAAKQAKVSAITDEKAPANGDRNTLVDIDCDEATLADILRQFRKTTGANIITPDSSNLMRRVSASLRRVKWFDALQSMLNSRGFRLEERESIYFVNEDKQATPIFTETFVLNHASADEMAKLFNDNYAVKDKSGKIIQNIANSFSGANVVVVTASEKILNDCKAIIKAVDKAVAQIYIEARFIELSSEALRRLGVQWDTLSSWRVSASQMKGGFENNNGRAGDYGEHKTSGTRTSNINDTGNDNANTSSDGSWSNSKSKSSTSSKNNSDSLVSLVPQAIGEASKAGLGAADMAWKNAYGFSGQLSAQDFSLAMSAFESLGEGRIFSNPKVIVSNGKEANVDMTTKFPNVEITSQRNTSTTTPYTDYSTRVTTIPGDASKGIFAGDIFYSWGITLSVKPRISPDGLISVVITPSISQLSAGSAGADDEGFYQVQSSSSDEDAAAYSKFPVIEMKKITTEFTMKDGATAVIGGLSKTAEEDIDTGIPYLRKIPWIGQKLFGWTSRHKVQKEIIVCVTIGIANPDALPTNIGLPKNAVMGREYIEGRKLEPGDRAGTDAEILALDIRDLDEQRRDPKIVRRNEAYQAPEEKIEQLPKETPDDPAPQQIIKPVDDNTASTGHGSISITLSR